MTKSFDIVPFHQHELLTVREAEEVLVPLKPIVESMGLMWHPQLERVKRHPVLSEGIRVTRIPSQGGMQESACLTLEMVPGFLATIQSDRIKEPAVREAVVLFQREAFHVIFQHYFGGKLKPGGAGAVTSVGELIRLSDQVKAEANPALREAFYEMLQQGFSARGIETPPLEAITLPSGDAVGAEKLLGQIDALLKEQPDLDHHRTDELIAVRMRDVAANGVHVTKSARTALRDHPRFMGERSVNSRFGKSIHCWVFRAA